MSYDPKLGRFLERDPVNYEDGPNLYQYARSNPLAHVDPMGTTAIRIDADAFIPMAWVDRPVLGGNLKGDDREISWMPGERSRIATWIEVEVDGNIRQSPEIAHGATQSESTLTEYLADPVGSEGAWVTEVAIGSGNYTLRAERKTPCSVVVYVDQVGSVPKKFALAPAIDYHYRIWLTQDRDQVKYHLKGKHDGFPAYEVYLQSHLIHSYDPRKSNTGPMALFGSGDVQVDESGVDTEVDG
jgi:uncharacterized protein RhaS with RHS repeats